MIAVQPENCAPLARAMNHPDSWKEHFTPYASIASGLAVPYPFGMDLMLDVIDSSGGEVVTVSEKEIIEGVKQIAQTEGLLLSPEASAAWKGVEFLLRKGKITEGEKVLFLNTGSGYKYMESLSEHL